MTSRSARKQKSAPSSKGAGFSGIFFEHTPAEDIAGWKKEHLESLAKSLHSFAKLRAPQEHKVRVYTPDQKKDGWHIPHTVIEMVNPDMPFIVDSIASELAHRELVVETLLHPILNVKRNDAGSLQDIVSIKKAAEGFHPESFIFVQLEQSVSVEDAASLEERLRHILADVRAATADWQPMLKKMDQVIADLEGKTKGVPRDSLVEALDLLAYLRRNNFTFLGYSAYAFSSEKNRVVSRPVEGSCLGVLRNNQVSHLGQGADSPERAALAASKEPVLISKLIDQYAAVHRRVPMDAVMVKVFDAKGNLCGAHLFVGLFTSSTYSCRTAEVPLVRQKVRQTIERSGFAPGMHDRKALEHILEKIPRDELFYLSANDLYDMSLGILRLQSKRRVALFAHVDPVQSYMSCLVYVPRDRYNTKFRKAAERILERATGGKSTNFFTNLDDSPLARVLFTVKLEAPLQNFDHAGVEQQLIDLTREWDERLKQILIAAFGKAKGLQLSYLYGSAFGSAYHASIDICNAPHDIQHLEKLLHGEAKISVDLFRRNAAAEGDLRLKVYHKGKPVPLSDILPILANMGLRSLSEMPFEVKPQGSEESLWIHEFALEAENKIDIGHIKEAFEETFLHVWQGEAENDALNKLVVLAGLTWREVMILRTYNSYMRQARFPFSREYIEQALGLYPAIARELVTFFKEKHDPSLKKNPAARGEETRARILDLLQSVQKLDHDRILRGFTALIDQTLRTNYFQTDENGAPKPTLAIKLDSKNIPDLPLPRPHVEIFVHARRVEAIHLRGGDIARGGIRWSDRHDDFRTEILSLMKSQMVKNAVIVPVGAKGGFVVKQPPKTGGREAYQQEGIACYKLFVQSLLDITDNNVDGKIVRPRQVVCHDGVDPYLVVAADKGTATFSNIANELSLKAGFWLQDAFASGGSTGYDHKEMAITARGGWESVKRHFREMGKDTQTEAFTVVGVGDMAGDVFGNGMLLSEKILLQGAFNHAHVFIDPTPDEKASFLERQRLFRARGGWDQYDAAKISAGGGVFDRTAKSIKITPQMKKAFGIKQDHMTPDELIRTLLTAEVELIWFGGIGTFIKSSKQSHADADDKSNDNLRVDARDVRAKVIGEGANLGVTQLARVEYAQRGGRINTDFIDNSGGVDCSDHEVNIKILLSDVVAKGKMTLPARNKLLENMKEDVAALVLRDNYQQTQSLSFLSFKSREQIGMYAEFIRDLEKAGHIKRTLEGLPDDETLDRLSREGKGLTRPELSVLLPYAKMTLFNELMATSLPDDPALEGLLFDYFPKPLHKFAEEIRQHKLKRHIVATQIVNTLVNRMGPVFVRSRMQKTGATAEDVVKAFMIAVGAFRVTEVWKEIEALDHKVPATVQMAAFFEVWMTVKRLTTWFLRFGEKKAAIDVETSFFMKGVDILKSSVERILPEKTAEGFKAMREKLAAMEIPVSLADKIAMLDLLASAGDIVRISRLTKTDVKDVADSYFQLGEKLSFNWLRRQAGLMVPRNLWQARMISGMMDDFYGYQAALALEATQSSAPLEKWLEREEARMGKFISMLGDLKVQPVIEPEMLVLVSQRIGQIIKAKA